MRRAMLLIPLVAGCLGGDKFHISGATCDADYLDWGGGLTFHVLQGNGNGAFDYDPTGDLEERIAGSYSLSSGDFAWDTEYSGLHWRTGRAVEGYGYAKTDGDLDVQYTVVTTDVNGDTYSAEVREERVGCDVVRRTDVDGDTIWQEGTYHDDRYEYVQTSPSFVAGPDFEVEGTVWDDLAWSESLDYSGGGLDYQYTEDGDGEGYSRRDWAQSESGNTYAGYTEYFIDGARHVHYDVNGDATWDYVIDFDGDGGGTYSEPGLDCDITFSAGDCFYDCDGSTGSC